MQGVFINASTGRQLTAKSFQRSHVGTEFDDYMFQALAHPFPFSPIGPASRSLEKLWKNRSCKIFYNGKWRTARVCTWKQYNPAPSAMITNWSVEMQLDTVEPNDEVEYVVTGQVMSNDLKHQEGTAVTVATTSNDGDTSAIIVIKQDDDDDDDTFTNFHPRMTFHVNRMNVAGGGTLKLLCNGQECGPLLSLQWLDPASPVINLDQNVLSLNCPCCRANVGVAAAFDDVSVETRSNAECPVCLETTTCRNLECGHGVCLGCWNRCRQAAIKRVSRDLGELDQDRIKVERQERNRLFFKKRSRGGESAVTNSFAETFSELAEAATDVEGLKRLQWELMVENPNLWISSEGGVDNYTKLSMDGLKVLVQALAARQDEVTLEGGQRRIAFAYFFSCFLIARAHDEVNGDARAAIPWADLSLYFIQRFHGDDDDDDDETIARNPLAAAHLASGHLFCGQVRSKLDLLTESLECLDASASVGDEESEACKRCRAYVMNEMQEWTGTSFELPSGV